MRRIMLACVLAAGLAGCVHPGTPTPAFLSESGEEAVPGADATEACAGVEMPAVGDLAAEDAPSHGGSRCGEPS